MLRSELAKAVAATGHLDQVGYPADRRDHRIVPLLEVDARSLRQGCRVGCDAGDAVGQFVDQYRGLAFAADQRPHRADHLEDFRQTAVIEDVDGHAGSDQLGGDVRLQVRKAEHEVRLERQDAVDLGAEKGGHTGLFAPRARRADGEARDADDPRLLTEQVEGLGGLFSETDDPPWSGG